MLLACLTQMDTVLTAQRPGLPDEIRRISFMYGLDAVQVQIGLALRNWWMSSDYSGLSPEVSQFGNEAVGGSVDTNPFPLSKSMYLTLSMGF